VRREGGANISAFYLARDGQPVDPDFGAKIKRHRVMASFQGESVREIFFLESSRPVMMNAARAMGELTRSGFKVEVVGPNLLMRGPRELAGHEYRTTLTGVEAGLVEGALGAPARFQGRSCKSR
jgi:hypothetical protein